MIRIHNILDIIKISTSIEPNKFIQKNYENVHLNVSFDFQSSMGLGKSRCDIHSGTTQGQDCPQLHNLL